MTQVPVVPTPGTYDKEKQLRLDESGRPVAKLYAGEKVLTLTEKDPADPQVIASTLTESRADKDPVDPADAVLMGLEIVTKADKDPADPIRSGEAFGQSCGWGDSVITGRVAT